MKILTVTHSSHIEQSQRNIAYVIDIAHIFVWEAAQIKTLVIFVEMETNLFCQPVSKNYKLVILEICVCFVYALHLEDNNKEILTVNGSTHIFCWKGAQIKLICNYSTCFANIVLVV